MKHLKKLASFLLTMVMVLGLSNTAFAAANEGTLTGGSIKIQNAVSGQTYNAYQIMYLESYNPDTGAYAYKANSEWSTWLATQTEYVSIDDQGYITWVKKDAQGNPIGAADFAKAAAGQLTGKSISGTITPTADGEATISGLNLGYYLVDTTLGTLCSLDTTTPDVTIREKNTKPTIEKEVQEDSDSTWGDSNTAEIGQTVNFKTTVHAKAGAQNYVVHDKMSAGLTFTSVTSVKVGNAALTAGTDYNVVTTNLDTGCTFHVVFTKTYLDTITADTDIVIEYTAVLNENAKISTEKETNDTKLDYGENNSTEWDHTDTYTFKFDLVKTDSDKKVLDGAKFTLYNAQTGGTAIALVKIADGEYRLATSNDTNTTTTIETKDGKAVIKGADSDSKTTYYLEETEAPAGYNKLPGRVAVDMTEGKNLDATVTDDAWTSGGVWIENKSGSVLPSTGGMGTTIFYVLGAVLMLGAAVILITKRRMNAR